MSLESFFHQIVSLNLSFFCLKIIWVNDYLLIQKDYFVLSNKEFLHTNIKSNIAYSFA